ncbi:MAG: alcohol dehydrogenase catalytic domain-containing protein [Pseudomonadota bacterium]
MRIGIAFIDDDPLQNETMEALVRVSLPSIWMFGAPCVVDLLSITAVMGADGGVDVEAITAGLQGFDPGVAVVDLRLVGDSEGDVSGVDLALRIKAEFPDCCILLTSVALPVGLDCDLLTNIEVFRNIVDRSQGVARSNLVQSIRTAARTHLASRVYRVRRFARTANQGLDCMWGLVLERGKPGVTLFEDLPLPALQASSVVVRTLEFGLCGTDRGALGATRAQPYDVIEFHEAFGRVVWVGESVRNLRVGDHVVPMVRRCQPWWPPSGRGVPASSHRFMACAEGLGSPCFRRADACPRGQYNATAAGTPVGYTSRGTGKCHGFGSQYWVDSEDWLVPVPLQRADGVDEAENGATAMPGPMMKRAVLTEPLSIAWKMNREVQRRRDFSLAHDRVLVIGIGPIGLLSAMLMAELHSGVRITAVDLVPPQSSRVKLLEDYYPGIRYFQAPAPDTAPTELVGQRFHVIVEATPQPDRVFRYAPSLLAPGGILALLGIAAASGTVSIGAGAFTDLVKRGNTILGSVNSSRSDFEESLAFMMRVMGSRKECLLDRLPTRWEIDASTGRRLMDVMGTTPLEKRDEIKVVLEADAKTTAWLAARHRSHRLG